MADCNAYCRPDEAIHAFLSLGPVGLTIEDLKEFCPFFIMDNDDDRFCIPSDFPCEYIALEPAVEATLPVNPKFPDHQTPYLWTVLVYAPGTI